MDWGIYRPVQHILSTTCYQSIASYKQEDLKMFRGAVERSVVWLYEHCPSFPHVCHYSPVPRQRLPEEVGTSWLSNTGR